MLGVLLVGRGVASPPVLNSWDLNVVVAGSSILVGVQSTVQLELHFGSKRTVAEQVSRGFKCLIIENMCLRGRSLLLVICQQWEAYFVPVSHSLNCG